MYYIHSDYLGNYETVTNERGNIVDKLSFDPCLPVRNAMEAGGRRRNPTNWTYNNVPQTHLFDRGFTGHSLSRHAAVGKHLDNFYLINMPALRSDSIGGNGRVYDPRLGRFLSPDPFVQNATNTQSHNRYSYALNNPLKYTDPSGYYSHHPPYYEGDFENNHWGAFDFAFSRNNPGSGNHWSDFYRSEWGNFMIMSTKNFDNFYGAGSSALVHNLMQYLSRPRLQRGRKHSILRHSSRAS